MPRTLLTLLLILAGCLPPPGPPSPVPPSEGFAARAKTTAATAGAEFRFLQSEVWAEAGRKSAAGESEQAVHAWLNDAEKAAARAAFQPFRELLVEASKSEWTAAERAAFFEAAAQGMKP
jgi:hypothetical protein